MANIIGTDARDVIQGSPQSDDIRAGGGNDLVFGKTGSDRIFGEAGNDTLFGEADNDVLIGGSGSDFIVAAAGADFIEGSDIESAGVGEIDRMVGGDGGDAFILGRRRDNGQAVIYYDDGDNDSDGRSDFGLITDFDPSEGDAIRLAGSSSDYVIARSPIFNISGDAIFRRNSQGGEDELIAITQNFNDLTKDDLTFIGGSLNSPGLFPELPGLIDFPPPGVVIRPNPEVGIGPGQPILRPNPPGRFPLINPVFPFLRPIEGTDAGETLNGTNNSNILLAKGGDDSVFALGGSDFVEGGGGSDTIDGGTGDDTLQGAGVFSGQGGDGNGEIDRLTGGEGKDTFLLHANKGKTVLYDAGNPRNSGRQDFAIITDFNKNQDTIELAGDQSEYFIGRSNVRRIADGRAIFRDTDNDGRLRRGRDELIAVVQGANDLSLDDLKFVDVPVLTGNGRAERILGNRQNGILNGKGGRDRLFGKGGDDILLGGGGNDLLNGGSGDDILDGGRGNDTYFGKGGADIFVIASGQGRDKVQDFQDGVDVIGLAKGLTFEALDIAQRGRNTLISLGSGAGSEPLATLRGIEASQITAEDFVSIGSTRFEGTRIPTLIA